MKEEELKKVKDEVIACQKCPLYKSRIYPVVGEGSHQAEIMFVGEAPGLREAETGRPFCGKAGKILDQLLKSVKINRGDVYIANILKDRPPQNRDPVPEEIKACLPYLKRQIEAIKPKVICALGRYSMSVLMEEYGLELESISKIHGKVFEAGNLKIIPLYHPAVAVYNPNMIEILKDDFKILRKIC